MEAEQYLTLYRVGPKSTSLCTEWYGSICLFFQIVAFFLFEVPGSGTIVAEGP